MDSSVRVPLPFISLESTHARDFDLHSLNFGLNLNIEESEFSIPLSWRNHEWASTYKHICSNRYVSPLNRSVFRYEEAPMCSCSSIDGCTSECENFQLSMECTPGNCPSVRGGKDEWCKNTTIQRACFPPTEVFRTGEYGHGLFTLQDLPPDTIIIEYCGEVITEKECLRRMASYKSTEHFYFASLQSGLVLDAATYGSTARFANHSCDPNCALQKWTVNGEPRVVLVATTFIKSGSELTYNYQYYQDGLDDIVSKFKRQACACGSRVCCGTIGGRVTLANPLRERETWISKATALLDLIDPKVQRQGAGGGKRCSVNTLEEMLGQAVDIDTTLGPSSTTNTAEGSLYCMQTEEYARLVRVVQVCRDWQQLMEATLRSPVLLSSSAFDTLVESLSYRVRVDAALHSKVESVKRAVRNVSALCRNLFGDDLTQSMVLRGAAGLLCVSEEKRLQWSVFAKIAQQLYDAIPVACHEWARVILQEYQNYTKWAEDLFGAMMNRADSYVVSLDEKTLPSLWTVLSRLADYYDIKVSSTVFWLERCVGERLGAYVNREQHSAACTQVLASAASTNECRTTLDDPSKPHCFCRLTEDSAELKTLVQCDTCSDWYHMECANISAPSDGCAKSVSSTDKRRAAVLQKIFKCPLCQHKSTPPEPNNFLVVQPYEWHKGVSKTSISQAHLLRCVEGESRLLLSETPLSIYALQIVRAVESWQLKAQEALAQGPAAQDWACLADSRDLSRVAEDSEEAFQSKMKVEDGMMKCHTSPNIDLSRLLELYFRLRLLCVCPDEVSSLRLLVWRCCMADIFNNPTITMPSQSIAYCKKYIRSGKSLCDSTLSCTSKTSESIPVEFRLLSHAVEAVVALIKRAHECRDSLEAAELLASLEGAEAMGVSVREEFAYAKLKSLVMVRPSECTEVGVVDMGKEMDIYCWCRSVDNGEPMVFCESCGEWFHYSCSGISCRRHSKLLREVDFCCIACSMKLGISYKYEWPSALLGAVRRRK